MQPGKDRQKRYRDRQNEYIRKLEEEVLRLRALLSTSAKPMENQAVRTKPNEI